MKLSLIRQAPHSSAVPGTLWVNGKFECHTLENASVLVPVGFYPLTVYFSPHAGHLVPLIQAVPGRDYIEMHCGNKFSDSKGCVLVGQEYSPDTLKSSRLAFAHLMPQVQAAYDQHEQMMIEIVQS